MHPSPQAGEHIKSLHIFFSTLGKGSFLKITSFKSEFQRKRCFRFSYLGILAHVQRGCFTKCFRFSMQIYWHIFMGPILKHSLQKSILGGISQNAPQNRFCSLLGGCLKFQKAFCETTPKNKNSMFSSITTFMDSILVGYFIFQGNIS